MRIAPEVKLSNEQRQQLEKLARGRTVVALIDLVIRWSSGNLSVRVLRFLEAKRTAPSRTHPRKGETVRERAKERYYTSEAARYNAAIGPLN